MHCHETWKEKKMKNQEKKTLLCRALAAVLCFAMLFSAIAPVTTQAASAKALALKYKGKTVNIFDCPAVIDDWNDYKCAAYGKIKKAFGKPDKVSTDLFGLEEKITAYTYQADGFKFQFSVLESEKNDPASLRRITIKITSTKAVLNGIKVGMPYDEALKKLEKNYGSGHITTQDNKKKIVLWVLDDEPAGIPIEFTFKNGKVSKMYVFCS